MVEKKSKGVRKPLERSRSSGSIRAGERKLDSLDLLLDNGEEILELGEEKAKDGGLEMGEIA